MQSNQGNNDRSSIPKSSEPDGIGLRANAITTNDACQVSREVFNMAAGFATNAVSKKMLEKVGNFVDRKARLFEGLEKFLPPPIPGVARGPKRLRDKEYIWLSEWCAANGFEEWGMRPRTFVILHMMGCPEAIDGFVEEKQYDSAIPYTEENLPRVIKGSKRKEFITYQEHVLTAHAKALEYSGKHQNVNGSADDFFFTEKELGSGGFGTVDYVISRQSLQPFARKRIARGRSFKKDRDAIRMFENELKNLKLLSHRHLVKLIGSYTDVKYVGLIMTPVADMDLDVFLSSSQIDPVDRQSCLRRFYGCLATAVEYLHLNQIRHKDIKPKNALVKDRQILLADFGTSHNWADDARSTTSGTNKQAFTKAYCAPEVFMHGSRNPSSDIWSLGCVFFDMSTVLAGFSIADRKAFFQSHGTSGLYIRDNEAASKLWIDDLKLQASRVEDNQILDLIQSMCHLQQDERPTATEVVSEILDFDGTPYYGFCCDRNDTHRSSEQDRDNTTTFYENDTVTARPESSASSHDVVPRLLLGADACYAPPSVQEIEDGMTIQNLIPDEKSLFVSANEAASQAGEQDHDPDHDPEHPLPASEDGDEESDDKPAHSENMDSIRDVSPSAPTQKSLSDSYVPPTIEEIEDGMTIRHLIPTMETLHINKEDDPSREPGEAKETVRPQSSTEEYHDPGPSSRERRSTVATQASANINYPWKCAPHKNLKCLWPNCKFTTLFSAANKLKSHLRIEHGIHDIAWTALLQDTGFSNIPRDLTGSSTATTDPYTRRLRSKISERRRYLRQKRGIRYAGETSASDLPTSAAPGSRPLSRNQKTVRFGGLPEELRPQTKSPEPIVEPSSSIGVRVDHLTYQHVDQLWQLSRDGQKPPGSALALPDSSLVPSFYLALTNLFSKQEVDSFTRLRRFSGFGPRPLFVCGSLMFPSILKARAESYMTSEGMYSERLQRRLRTNSADWGKINLSIQQAAESMTPAVIKYHSTSKQRGFSPSILRRTYGPIDQVSGFLIFGLTEDALACLDHMFSPETDSDILTDSSRYSWPEGLTFIRQPIDATISVKGGQTMVIDAEAFIATGGQAEMAHFRQLDSSWDINRFVRGRSFRKLSSNHTGEAPWVDEEEQLAEAMRIKFILHGDALCDAIIAEDKDKVLRIIDKRVDVNAPCHVYGTALQAAAFKGNEEVADLLLRQGARVNAKGGQYQNALIAATVTEHENVVKLLLKNGADVLADGGRYISALYQAVDFSDLQLARALLEKGGWLSANYRELLDLAGEHGSREMTRLLEEYDVKMLHLKPKQTDDGDGSEDDNGTDAETVVVTPGARALRRDSDGYDDRVDLNKAALIKQVGFKIMVLKGQRGKWTGIKGVQIFKAAIQAGMDESIVDKARPHLRTAQNILDWLMKAVTEANEQNLELERNRRRTITDGVERGRGNRRRASDDNTSQASSTINMPPGTRRNTVSNLPLPNDNRTRPSTSGSPIQTRTSGGGPSTGPSRANQNVCTTCNGRGGRLGTEHRCHVCGGSGRPRRRSGGSRSMARGQEGAICSNCSGKGHVYSDMDSCQPCAGSGVAATSSNMDLYGSRELDPRGAQDDPPPPYTTT